MPPREYRAGAEGCPICGGAMYVLKFLLAEGEGRSLRNSYSFYYVHRGYRTGTRTGIVSQVHTLQTVSVGGDPTHAHPVLGLRFWSHTAELEAYV